MIHMRLNNNHMFVVTKCYEWFSNKLTWKTQANCDLVTCITPTVRQDQKPKRRQSIAYSETNAVRAMKRVLYQSRFALKVLKIYCSKCVAPAYLLLSFTWLSMISLLNAMMSQITHSAILNTRSTFEMQQSTHINMHRNAFHLKRPSMRSFYRQMCPQCVIFSLDSFASLSKRIYLYSKRVLHLMNN